MSCVFCDDGRWDGPIVYSSVVHHVGDAGKLDVAWHWRARGRPCELRYVRFCKGRMQFHT